MNGRANSWALRDHLTPVAEDRVASTGELIALEPPASPGAVTVLDVFGARDLAEHTERVEEWARSVWEAWEHHHATVSRWTDR